MTEQGVLDAVVALHGRKTILIVAHRMSTVAHCDRLYRLADGVLDADTRQERAVTAATRVTG